MTKKKVRVIAARGLSWRRTGKGGPTPFSQDKTKALLRRLGYPAAELRIKKPLGGGIAEGPLDLREVL